MALGGYKFAGYYAQWDGSMTDVQLSLLIHKTRLKAFVEANTKAGSSWHFCKNGGTIDFEDNTGVIYNIASDQYDFISFFQYGDENKYIAILTFPDYVASLFNVKARGQGYYVSGSNRYIWDKRSLFHCASITPFEEVDFWYSSYTYPSGALPMVPLTTFNMATSSTNMTTSYTGSMMWIAKQTSSITGEKIKLFFGYAMKGSRVIHIFTSTADDNSGSYTQISQGEMSVGIIGFDGLKLSSPSDTKNLFHALLTQLFGSQYEYGYPKKTSDYRINSCVQILNSSGNMYAKTGYASACYISTSCAAGFVYGISNEIPYAQNFVTTQENGNPAWEIRTTGDLLNSDGIFTKGVIDLDLIASNITNASSNLQSCGAYANGNYLLACKDYGVNMQTYCGWDPSNPDITLDASWTKYNG